VSAEIGAPEYQILAEFRQNLRRFLNFSERAAKERGLETQQYQLILAIKRLPAVTKATIVSLPGGC
jgi:hypothetical protein